MKVKIKQFRNKAKEPVAGLTPEHAIYDTNGTRLDAKLGNINLQEFRDLQHQGINAIKDQENKSVQAVANREVEILAKSDASKISSTAEGLEGGNVEEKLTDAGSKLTKLENRVGNVSSFNGSANKRFPFSFVVGKTYRFTNRSESTYVVVGINTQATGGTTKNLGQIPQGEYRDFKITQEASYLVIQTPNPAYYIVDVIDTDSIIVTIDDYQQAIEKLDDNLVNTQEIANKTYNLEIEELIFEQGTISNGTPIASSKRIRSVNYIHGTKSLNVKYFSKNIAFLGIQYYNETTLEPTIFVNKGSEAITIENNSTVAKVVLYKINDDDITPDDIKWSDSLEFLNKETIETKNALENTNKEVQDIKNALGDIATFELTANKRFEYKLVAGKSYIVKNEGNSGYVQLKGADSISGGDTTFIKNILAGTTEIIDITISYNFIALFLAESTSAIISIVEADAITPKIKSLEQIALEHSQNISSINEEIQEIENFVFEVGSVNLYTDSSERKTIDFINSSVFKSASHRHCVILPIDASKSIITVIRPGTTSTGLFRAVTSEQYPTVGEAVLDVSTGNNINALTITPSANAHYLCIMYWIDNADPEIESYYLEGLKVFYGTEWKEQINKIEKTKEFAEDIAKDIKEVRVCETDGTVSTNVACTLKAGQKYIIKNTSEQDNYFAIYARETATSANVTISDTLGWQQSIEYTPDKDYQFVRLSASPLSVSNRIDVITVGTVDNRLDNLEKKVIDIQDNAIINKKSLPLVKFDFSHDLLDFTGEADVFQFVQDTSVEYYPNFMQQLYDKFDALMAKYSNYISKVDAPEYVNIEYPDYASEYRTYMYIFKPVNEAMNEGYTKPKKALWIGGTHSGERWSCLALYYMAKAMCECMNDDYFKLRNSFEIHIIPVLEGYGSIHAGDPNLPAGASQFVGRTNYNGININRNYPSSDWKESGTGTVNYTGSVAGSEFENRVIMALNAKEKYDMLGDYHSHVESVHVMYSETPETPNTDNTSRAHACYDAAADISITFKKKYPAYYGVGGDILPMGPGPAVMIRPVGRTHAYFAEIGVPCAYLQECPCVISWNDGKHSGGWHEVINDNIFQLNEYLFRCQTLHLCDFVLRCF